MSLTHEPNAVDGGAPAAQTSGTGWSAETEAQLRADAAAIIARYPQPRSALGPMLHLIQSVDAFVSPRGVALCAELLDLSRAEVSAVATFYSQYKRKPNGSYTLGVCTNTLCAVMGGDEVWEAVSDHLGIGHDETTDDGAITLERVECNAACDYAPVVMVNWEFFDNQTPTSVVALADKLVAGETVTATRGPEVADFKGVSRVLAGFEDGRVDGGATPGKATLAGLELAREKNWHAPGYPAPAAPAPEAAAPQPVQDALVEAPKASGAKATEAPKATTPKAKPTTGEAKGTKE